MIRVKCIKIIKCWKKKEQHLSNVKTDVALWRVGFDVLGKKKKKKNKKEKKQKQTAKTKNAYLNHNNHQIYY